MFNVSETVEYLPEFVSRYQPHGENDEKWEKKNPQDLHRLASSNLGGGRVWKAAVS